ncbi:MAG: response regulator transcription factor [Corynebacterium casei]|nr:response regulator transcription factor [Corynebacterium casei]
MSISILLVDDEESVRELLPKYFRIDPELEVVTTTNNGRSARAWLEDNTCDIVLSDIHMPGMNGLELLSYIKELDSPPVFIAMTAFDTDETMMTALANGAAGYVIKGHPPRTIIQAIHNALRGGTSLSPQCVKRLVSHISWNQTREGKESTPMTSSEKSVIKLVRRGKSNREIAKTLHFSESYIKAFLSSLLEKSNCSSREELIAWFY